VSRASGAGIVGSPPFDDAQGVLSLSKHASECVGGGWRGEATQGVDDLGDTNT